MDCINIGSKIVTLAIQMHGIVINLDLSTETSRIFENVRVFSKAGDFDQVLTNDLAERHILYKVNEMFQRDLTAPTVELINEYVEYSQPKYRNYLEYQGQLNEKRSENVCRQFGNIFYDKSLSSADIDEDSGYLECLIDRFLPNFSGFFVVSVHEKIGENNFQLLYPKQKSDKTNLNLLLVDDFKKFADIFDTALPDLKEYSTILPSYKDFINEDNSNLKQQFFRILNGWDLTLKGDKIESIKLSTMVDFVKRIVGPSCKINLFDYSCNGVSMFVPKDQLSNKQYLIESYIEQGFPKGWGGKKIIKEKRNTRSKSKSKRSKKRHKSNSKKQQTKRQRSKK